MTPRIRTPDDRARVLANTAATVAYLTTSPHTIHALREAIVDRLPDGMRAASYDQTRATYTDTIVEAAVMDPSTAPADLAAVDDALVAIARAIDTLHRLTHRYPIFDPGTAATTARRPGQGKAPVGRCATCWAYGREEWTDGHYGRQCRWCGDEAVKLAGNRPPREVWEVHRQGRRVTIATYRRLAPGMVKYLRTD
jgi:hypothetical protein